MIAFTITDENSTQAAAATPPEPSADEVLLRVRYVGLCGSDLKTYQGHNPMVEFPRIPGHEIAAIVEDTGEDVPRDFAEGDPVTVVPYSNCGQCAACQKGRDNACQFNQTLGVQRDGAAAEYVTVPWEKVLPATDLSLLETALVEPMTIGFHAVERAQVSSNDTVLVIGCGMIGLGCVAGSSARGARVVALDLDDSKLSLATECGAEEGINARQTDPADALDTFTDGDGPDVVIEAVGSCATYRQALQLVSFAGRVVAIGYCGEDTTLPSDLIVKKELDVRGSRNATPENFQEVLDHISSTELPVDRLINRVVPPEEAGEALAHWSANPQDVTKIIIEFNG